MASKRGNNEGSIRQRSDGTWEARVTLPEGKRKSLYGKTRAEVARKLTEARRALDQGMPVSTGRQTLGQFLDQWLRECIAPARARSTHEDYAQLVRNHIAPALGSLKLDQVTPQRIQRLLNDKRAAGLSPRTCSYIHAVLRSALSQAFRWQLIAWNPAKAVTPPRADRKEVTALAPEQATAIVSAFRGHDFETLVTMVLALGLRQGEALALRWSDVDLDGETIAVRNQVDEFGDEWVFTDLKTASSRRTLPLPRFAIAALRAQRTSVLQMRLSAGAAWTDLDLVFPNPWGTPRDGSRVTHTFQAVLARANLPRMRFHDLRHGAASLLLARGVPLRTIQEILGHSTYTITANLYAHVAPQLKRDAADHMDAIFGVS